ncbi:MAG: starch-binding protein, partial [Muribaculaceae bacterium]|nr:starch-binding protein [Muribaculaceae bacterium]
MKKLFTTWLLLAIAVLGFQAKADLWLIGELSPYSWVPNQGVQFTLVSGNDYTLDLNVTSTGDKYFALTTQLASSASDWDAIKPYRFGGQGYVVTLGEDLALVAGDDHSPKVTIPAVGVYTIKFNTSTRVINISRKDGDDTPEFVMPDFCTWQDGKNFVYIEDTNNWGASGINIYTWNGYDNGGWPGQANVNSTPVGQYEGHNVYLFDVPTSTPGNLIISNNGNNRFTGGNLNWVNGGYYNAGGMQGVVEQTTPTEPAWFIAGSFTDPAWADGKQALTKGNDGSFSITIPGIEDGAEFKFIDQDNKWYGGDTGGNEGNYGVHKDWCTDIDLAQGDNGSNFQVSGGGDLTFTISADKKLTITGWAEPTPEEPTLYVIGDFQNWKPNAGQELTYDENTKLFGGTVTLADEGFIKFTTKLQETEEWGDLDNYLIGAVRDGDFVMTQELLGEEIALEAQGDAIKLPAGEWTLSADIENNKLVITGTWPETPVLEDTLYIAGSFTDPAWADGKVMMNKNDTAFVYTINGAEEGMEFKFIDREGNWYGSEAEGESFWLNSEVSEATLVTPGKNFYINGTGNLVVTVSLDKTTVSVTGWDAAPAVEITAVELRGSKNEWAEPIATFEVKNASTGYWEL